MVTGWDKIRAARRMQEHIEENLRERITMASLARVARYSPWHAARIFKEITGRSPFEYIRLRRLSTAALELKESRRKVIDVAFDFVFDSHEGFTRAFARTFGISPRRYRKGDIPVELFMPPRLEDWYRRRQRGEIDMSESERKSEKRDVFFVQVVDRPARKLIYKAGKEADHYFAYCEEVGCEVWDRLGTIPDALQEPLGLWLPANLRPDGCSAYVQGVEVAVEHVGEVPDGFQVLELPPCRMMVFQGPPFEDRDFEKAIASLWDVMKTYEPERWGFAWADEDGPRFQMCPEGYRGYIEGRPVRSLAER